MADDLSVQKSKRSLEEVAVDSSRDNTIAVPFPLWVARSEDSDWVLLGQLIGDFETYRRMVPRWPLLCFDLQQASVATGGALMFGAALNHYALDDARWVMSEVKRLGL